MPQSTNIPHPGEILVKEFLVPRAVTQYRVAVDTGVPPRRINEIVHGKRGITADTALRLSRYFDNDPLYWLQLQARWDLQRARDRLGSRLTEEVGRLGQSVEARPLKAKPVQAKAKPVQARAKAKPVQPKAKPVQPKAKPVQPKLADHLL